MKRLITIMLAMLFTFSAVACAQEMVTNVNVDSTWPVVNEKISVEIAVIPQNGSVTEDPEEFISAKYYADKSNLDITWTLISPSTKTERIQLMMSTGEFPDAILGYGFSANQVTQYGVDEQLFYPIDELMDYMPAFSALLEERPDYKAAITAPDGHIYGYPQFADNSISAPTRLFMNIDWLEALDLEIPTTLDELYDVFVAFRDGDPNGNGEADEIPLSGSWSDNKDLRGWMLSAYGIGVNKGNNLGLDYASEDAGVVYAPRQESFKDYLTYMNKLWNEGLIDADMFTQSNSQYNARLLEGRIGFGRMAAPHTNYPTDPEAYEITYPVVAEAGQTPIYVDYAPVTVPARAVINSECELEKAAALANFFDSMYTVDEYILNRYGAEKGSEYSEEYGYYYDAEQGLVYALPEGYSSAWNWKIDKVTFWELPGDVGYGNDAMELAYAEANPDTALGQYLNDGIVRESWVTPCIERCYIYKVASLPNFLMSAEDYEVVSELGTALDEYVESMEAKFITGAEPLENIDKFWAQLDELGVEEYLAIYAKYYEAYLANM